MAAPPSSHPTDRTLHAYGLGKLDEASTLPVERHLECCTSCQRRVGEFSSDTLLGRLREARGEGNDDLVPPVDLVPPELASHPDYEVIRELGRGGMGVVYLAQNRLMGRLEVLKVVGGHLVEKPHVLERFLREIRSAAKLQHPNIVTAYAATRVGSSVVLAMEYIDGEDLGEVVRRQGPLPVFDACHFTYQAALGLQHAHERGMVHRDIKPANLMLVRDGKKAVVKILDFGLAKLTSEAPVDGGLTQAGQMLGTPDYIAPEQIRDAQASDIRADIYSLGCTLYYLIAGEPPFRGQSLFDILQAHHSVEARPLDLVRPEVPAELAAIVARMLAKEPAQRFPSPIEVADALESFFLRGRALPGPRPAFGTEAQAAEGTANALRSGAAAEGGRAGTGTANRASRRRGPRLSTARQGARGPRGVAAVSLGLVVILQMVMGWRLADPSEKRAAVRLWDLESLVLPLAAEGSAWGLAGGMIERHGRGNGSPALLLYLVRPLIESTTCINVIDAWKMRDWVLCRLNKTPIGEYADRPVLMGSGSLAVPCADESQVLVRSIEIEEPPEIGPERREPRPGEFAADTGRSGIRSTRGALGVAWPLGSHAGRYGGGRSRSDWRLELSAGGNRAPPRASAGRFASGGVGQIRFAEPAPAGPVVTGSEDPEG